MADPVSTDVPLVDVRNEAGRWVGYITPPWFRYLLASNPDGFGTGTGVLHGNSSGSPTWGPVDLTTDVTGLLPVAHGGLGGLTGIAGGLLYATGASSYSVTAAGTAHQVLHGGATPTWGAVDVSADTTGTLPVLRGGTGVTTSTGTGAVVLNNSPSLVFPSLFGGQWNSMFVIGSISWSVLAFSIAPQFSLANSNQLTVNTGPVTIVIADHGLFWAVVDRTNGGAALGMMEPTGGIHVIHNSMVNVTFTRAAGVGLQVTITGAPFIRTFLTLGMDLGV